MKQGQKTRSIPLSFNIRNVDEEKLQITHTVNTKTLDRYGTVVLPKGADVTKFQQNPVVLWLHNMDETLPKIPIARCVQMDVQEDAIVVTTEFNRNDPLAVKVFQAYKDGFLHAWSIGFIPQRFTEITPENQEEVNKQYGLSLKLSTEDFAAAGMWGLWVIHQWELLEYSAVPVPGNPDALNYDAEEAAFTRELVTRGLVEEEEVRRINFRELLKKQNQKAETEAASGTEQPAAAAPIEAAPAPEAPALAAPVETPAPAETPAPEAPAAQPTEAPATEQAPSGSEQPTESTAAAPVVPEKPVAETQESEAAREAQTQVTDLTQKNKELAERLAQMEAQMTEMKANLNVDNIERIRAVAQKKLNSGSPDTFFSRLLKG